MEKSPLIARIEAAVSPTAESMGFEIVRVLMVGSGKPTLQIMAEDPATGLLGVDDCENLSRALSAVLDVENLIDGAYYLEVSSPGIDRPLTRLKDFVRYAGSPVRIEIEGMIDNQRRFKGRLEGVRGSDGIVMTDEGRGEIVIPFASIVKAKVMLEDDLIKKASKGKK